MLSHYNTNLFLHAFPFIPFASHPTNPCSGQLRWQDRAFWVLVYIVERHTLLPAKLPLMAEGVGR